uniref:Reverse transcriptase domain-containing protein n=1 Tax=Solanum lycopersicum TaxID=4081 RepID=A0A3Q7HLT4_SOLLC
IDSQQNDGSVFLMEDQEKTTFTCHYGTLTFKRMPFGLCNAPATFQRYMMSIFSDIVEEIIELRLVTGWRVLYRLPIIKCMEQEGPFSYALDGPDVTIKSLLHQRINRKQPLLDLMGRSHSRGCLLDCVMHHLLFIDI